MDKYNKVINIFSFCLSTILITIFGWYKCKNIFIWAVEVIKWFFQSLVHLFELRIPLLPDLLCWFIEVDCCLKVCIILYVLNTTRQVDSNLVLLGSQESLIVVHVDTSSSRCTSYSSHSWSLDPYNDLVSRLIIKYTGPVMMVNYIVLAIGVQIFELFSQTLLMSLLPGDIWSTWNIWNILRLFLFFRHHQCRKNATRERIVSNVVRDIDE